MGQAQTTTLRAPRREIGSFLKDMMPLALVLVFVLIVLPILAFTLPGIVSLSAAVVFLSLWMMEREVGIFNLRRITIPSFYYWMYFAVILIPGFVVYQDEIS